MICGTGKRNFCGTQSGTHPLTDLDTIILPPRQMSTEEEYDPGGYIEFSLGMSDNYGKVYGLQKGFTVLFVGRRRS